MLRLCSAAVGSPGTASKHSPSTPKLLRTTALSSLQKTAQRERLHLHDEVDGLALAERPEQQRQAEGCGADHEDGGATLDHPLFICIEMFSG